LLGSDPEQIKRIKPGERTLALLEDLQGNYVVEGSERYIEVEMHVAFSHTNKRGFLNETVGKWLREHAVRPGVPYIIEVESISTNQALLQTVKVTEDGTEMQRPAGAGRKPSGRAPSRNRGNAPRGNSRGGGGMGAPGMGAPAGGGGQQPGRRQHTGEKIDPGAGPAGGSGIGSQSGEYVGNPPGGSGFGNSGFGSNGTSEGWRNGKGTGSDEALTLDLATAAPIPSKPSLYAVGDEYYLGRVTFRIKFVDPHASPSND
jgi:hypothetical protein